MTAPDASIFPPTIATPPACRWPDYVAILLLMALAVIIANMFAAPMLSFDELWHLSLSVATGSPQGWFVADTLYLNPPRVTTIEGARGLGAVWTGMDGVLHPPLYVTTLRIWREVFGDGDRAAQAYSMFWQAIAVAASFAACRLTMGRGLAIAVGVAVAGAQTQAYFAQEVRGYAMLVGVAAIALWLMQRVETRGVTRGRAVGVALMTLPILLTHYFGAGGALAIAIWGFLRLRGERRAFAIALAASAVIYAVIWLPFAVRQLDDLGTGDAFMHMDHVPLREELGLLAAAPMRLIVDRMYKDQPEWLAGGILFIVPWLLLRRAPWLLPWVLWLSCGAAVLVALDLSRSTVHLALVRYLAVLSPAVVPLLVGCVKVIDRRLAYVAAAAVAFMGAIHLVSKAADTADSIDFGSAQVALEQRAQPGEAILAYHGQLPLFCGDMMLLSCSHSRTLFPRPVLNVVSPISQETLARLPRRLWLMAGPLDRPLQELIPGARELLRYNVELRVSLYHIELPASDDPATSPAATLPSRP